MRRLIWVGFAVAVAGCGGGGRVAPVRPTTIAMNSEVSGTLSRNDARLNDGSVYQAWSFYGTQGQVVQIDVMSDAFDAFCILQGPAGNEIARDDDSGEGLNARVSVALPVTGTYRVIANTYRQNQFGRYRVRLTGGAAAPVAVQPMPVQPMVVPTAQIAIGQSMMSQLTLASPVNNEGRRYAMWTFAGAAGQAVQIDMASNDLDSYLILQDQMGNELARNDDGGGGLNARINYTLTYTGPYRIMAMSFRTSGVMVGTYTLSVQGVMAVAPQVTPMGQPMGATGVVGTIAAGQQASGVLSMADARYDGKPFQAYNFGCAAGQTFQMDVLSSWDNYALVFDPMGNVVARDDDSGEGLNARITYTCLVTGTYRLAVTVYSTDTTPGAYTMQVH